MKFDAFGLGPDILEGIEYAGFEEATPIQEQAIPFIMEGRDLIACAQTGTGKTAAFILPILQKMADSKDGVTKTLILVPTRELAIQVDQQVQGFAYLTHHSCLAVYGGGDRMDFSQEKKALSQGADIIIATPGKLISHLNMGYVKFGNIETLILDEADRMLDIGFYDDIMRIISFIPKKRQTLMFSATMPPKIKALSKKILKNPETITIALSKPAEGVLQGVYKLTENQKIPLIKQLLHDKPKYSSILIFTATKRKVTEVVRALRHEPYTVAGISSNLEQKEREQVVQKFRAQRIRVLVATDVMSRGIDIKDINLVINFDVPMDAEDYVHRIGRTARADATGVALTLVNRRDNRKLQKIEQLIGNKVNVIPLPKSVEKQHPPQSRPSKPRSGKKRGYRRGRRK